MVSRDGFGVWPAVWVHHACILGALAACACSFMRLLTSSVAAPAALQGDWKDLGALLGWFRYGGGS